MVATRRALLMLSAAVAALVAHTVTPGTGTAGTAAAAPAPRPPGAGARVGPVADVSHHGHVSLWEERIGVRVRSENRGPADLAGVTVRLRFSEPFAVPQELPDGCLWGGARVVLCGTGALTADGEARSTALDLRLAGRPAEVVVRVDTVWNGGAGDGNPRNNVHEVLAPSTGDAYVF
ncbi:hypothetical protein [Streptomyces sp. BE147]|uniref:hypothetical protein n=1 Tax=unclassified Streptomyces TaxID=2593676 RepID=UPI002E77F5E7|nr:hypothetical protein [Streptomyces sp. BE147]MEE1736345.1 hypothetical protein [Streptomyces sp. BE147]